MAREPWLFRGPWYRPFLVTSVFCFLVASAWSAERWWLHRGGVIAEAVIVEKLSRVDRKSRVETSSWRYEYTDEDGWTHGGEVPWKYPVENLGVAGEIGAKFPVTYDSGYPAKHVLYIVDGWRMAQPFFDMLLVMLLGWGFFGVRLVNRKKPVPWVEQG